MTHWIVQKVPFASSRLSVRPNQSHTMTTSRSKLHNCCFRYSSSTWSRIKKKQTKLTRQRFYEVLQHQESNIWATAGQIHSQLNTAWFLILEVTNMCSPQFIFNFAPYNLSIKLAIASIYKHHQISLIWYISIIYLVIYLCSFQWNFHSSFCPSTITVVQQRFCNLYLLRVHASCVSDDFLVLTFGCCCGNGRRNNRTCGSGACSM